MRLSNSNIQRMKQLFFLSVPISHTSHVKLKVRGPNAARHDVLNGPQELKMYLIKINATDFLNLIYVFLRVMINICNLYK